MKELGSCEGPISGEHLVSESVLKVLKDDGQLALSGVPWLPEGEQRILALKNLRANCLCKKHNSALSPLDEAAGHFFSSLKTFLETDPGEFRQAIVSGHDVERWLLKTAKASAVSGNLTDGKRKLGGAFSQDEILISMLDDPSRWPDGAGLYCMAGEVLNIRRFDLRPYFNRNEEIVALGLGILGIGFALVLDPGAIEIDRLLENGAYRPELISVRHPKSNGWMRLSWEDGNKHRTLELHSVGR